MSVFSWKRICTQAHSQFTDILSFFHFPFFPVRKNGPLKWRDRRVVARLYRGHKTWISVSFWCLGEDLEMNKAQIEPFSYALAKVSADPISGSRFPFVTVRGFAFFCTFQQRLALL